MAKKQNIFESFVCPYSYFSKVTKGGAMVFRVGSGQYEGYQFLRPATMVIKSYEKNQPGFKVSYFVTQHLEGKDVIDEEVELIKLKKSEKSDSGKWEIIDEIEVPADEMKNYLE